MSRRIARISARMTLRTRTCRVAHEHVIGVSVGLKARLCSVRRAGSCGLQNIGTHPLG